MELAEKLKTRLINGIDISKDLSDEDLKEIITTMVLDEYREQHISLKEKLRISRELFHSVRGLDVMQNIIEDDEVTEIMVNGYDRIFIEKKGRLYRYNGSFSSREKLNDIIQEIVAKANKRVNEASPIVDTRLPDGSRVSVVLNPVAVHGPAVTIRKFPKKMLTMEELVALGTLTQEASDYLKKLVEGGYNIFISGGTGSGKTTFLNALTGFIPPNERIITIEDSAELKIQNIENLVSLECRPANVEGDNEITIRELIKTALRMRPTRIIVGEVRGPEALDMLQAMNTGHDGSLSTGHGNSPGDMLTRLETMALMAVNLPLNAIRAQIASAIDVLVHLGRMRDGSRKVLEITQISGFENDAIRLSPLFVLRGNQKERGVLLPTGNRLIRRKAGWSEGFDEISI